MLRAYLVDDEPLALKRLARLLAATGKVTVIGSTTDPVAAVEFLAGNEVDLLFLDIEMPELSGFEVLARLRRQPPVIFTTAYNQYALRAFDEMSVDYLLKPIVAERLDRAIDKVKRLRTAPQPVPDGIQALMDQLTGVLGGVPKAEYPTRISSRVGDRIHLIDLGDVHYFFAEDKLTFAAVEERNYVVDASIADLEAKLDPARFLRIHRGTMVNVAYIGEIEPGLGGRLTVRLKDRRRTALAVARDRVRDLKERLGL